MAQYKYSKYERETVIVGNDAEDIINISTYQAVWRRRLLKLADARPNDVKILKQDEDYLEVEVPKRFLKITPPRFVSDEQREASRQRLLEYLERQKNNSLSEAEIADMQSIEENLDDIDNDEIED